MGLVKPKKAAGRKAGRHPSDGSNDTELRTELQAPDVERYNC